MHGGLTLISGILTFSTIIQASEPVRPSSSAQRFEGKGQLLENVVVIYCCDDIEPAFIPLVSGRSVPAMTQPIAATMSESPPMFAAITARARG